MLKYQSILTHDGTCRISKAFFASCTFVFFYLFLFVYAHQLTTRYRKNNAKTMMMHSAREQKENGNLCYVLCVCVCEKRDGAGSKEDVNRLNRCNLANHVALKCEMDLCFPSFIYLFSFVVRNFTLYMLLFSIISCAT